MLDGEGWSRGTLRPPLERSMLDGAGRPEVTTDQLGSAWGCAVMPQAATSSQRRGLPADRSTKHPNPVFMRYFQVFPGAGPPGLAQGKVTTRAAWRAER